MNNANQKSAAKTCLGYDPAGGIDHSFTIYLEMQDCGAYHVAMTPEAALMRWYPLGFFLTPEQARRLASDLNTHAAIAESPGAVPAEGGIE